MGQCLKGHKMEMHSLTLTQNKCKYDAKTVQKLTTRSLLLLFIGFYIKLMCCGRLFSFLSRRNVTVYRIVSSMQECGFRFRWQNWQSLTLMCEFLKNVSSRWRPLHHHFNNKPIQAILLFSPYLDLRPFIFLNIFLT